MAFYKFKSFITSLAEGQGDFDLQNDALRVYLSNTAPNAVTMTTKIDLPEIASGGGYSGAVLAPISTRSYVGAEFVISATGPIVWAGDGAGFGPLRYAVLYDDTTTDDLLIGYWDYPTTVNAIQAGEELQLGFTVSAGILKIA